MIIGEAFRRLFDGLTVDVINDKDETVNVPIYYGYGDQIELNRWIDLKNQDSSTKYPLVWYVIQEYRENGRYLESEGGLIIFEKSTIDLYNYDRSKVSYDNVIVPVWDKVKELLMVSDSFSFIYDASVSPKRYDIKDEPLYGTDIDKLISSYESDFKSTKRKGEKNIIIDVVDARFIEFKFRINVNCIK